MKITIYCYIFFLFIGLGYGMVMISGIVCVYYNVIIAWTLYYIYQSSYVAWASCDNEWNTPSCSNYDTSFLNSTVQETANDTLFFDSADILSLNSSRTTSSEEFWLWVDYFIFLIYISVTSIFILKGVHETKVYSFAKYEPLFVLTWYGNWFLIYRNNNWRIDINKA